MSSTRSLAGFLKHSQGSFDCRVGLVSRYLSRTSGLRCLILLHSGTKWPFPLVVKTSGEKYQYSPMSDFHMRIRGFPHLVLEVISQTAGGDRFRMLLQASCLARLGNMLRKQSSKPVVIMAIYIDNYFRATEYLLYQPETSSAEVLSSICHINWPDC